ncbi:hypothetical protein FHT44_004946 [Mycolicibacterium sp. BK634]|uniref:hypothetical protein n=1 Tax=Mycolicibacterium sp. BK634 TaxID=2587099 RepID=UPI0016184C76|nr:hypothetical protein [Mycolicibacterium sp. BK634]MBB3752434.1 hypothetical protein [Mycolicibacterium sp. BK634]
MTRNIFALRAVRDLIKKSPEKHAQDSWAAIEADQIVFPEGGVAKVSCGTTACVAGWAATLAGAKFLIEEDDLEDGVYYAEKVEGLDGQTYWVDSYARNVLGLKPSEAGLLFNGDLERKEVLKLLKRLIEGKDI